MVTAFQARSGEGTLSPTPYSLPLFTFSLLHFFTRSLAHFGRLFTVHCPLFTFHCSLSTAFRDPNHGERNFPHFRCVIGSFQKG